MTRLVLGLGVVLFGLATGACAGSCSDKDNGGAPTVAPIANDPLASSVQPIPPRRRIPGRPVRGRGPLRFPLDGAAPAAEDPTDPANNAPPVNNE